MLSKILSNAPAIIEAISELVDRIRMEPRDDQRLGPDPLKGKDRRRTEQAAELLDRARSEGKSASRSSGSSSSSGK